MRGEVRAPVTTLEDLDSLDEAEILEGYLDGRAGDPEPGGNRSRSYWHGWRNGAADYGHRPIDAAQRELAHAYAERARRQLRDGHAVAAKAAEGRGYELHSRIRARRGR